MKLITSNLNEALLQQVEGYKNPTRVDLISSYITKEGLEAVWPVFQKLEEQNCEIRVITTIQRKITDLESLDRLAGLRNTSVYVFWPRQPKLHAKGWLFLYGKYEDETYITPPYRRTHDHQNDTVIVGSSNLTRNGVQVAVDWNVLLRRTDVMDPQRPRWDVNAIIDNFHGTFSRYVESPRFTSCMFQHFNQPSVQRTLLEVDLLSDEEVVARAAPQADQDKWKEVKAEQERYVKALRSSLVPHTEIDWTKVAEFLQKIETRTEEQNAQDQLRFVADFPRFDIDDSIISGVEQEPKDLIKGVAMFLKARAGDQDEAATDEMSLQLAAPYFS